MVSNIGIGIERSKFAGGDDWTTVLSQKPKTDMVRNSIGVNGAVNIVRSDNNKKKRRRRKSNKVNVTQNDCHENLTVTDCACAYMMAVHCVDGLTF